MDSTVKDTIKSRQIAFLVADGFNAGDVKTMKDALEKEGAMAKIIGMKSKSVMSADGKEMKVDHALRTSLRFYLTRFMFRAAKNRQQL